MSFKNPVLCFFLFTSMLSLSSAGLELDQELTSLVNGKLRKLVSGCSEKGVAVGDIEPTISTCLEEFKRLGAQKRVFPSYPKYPDSGENHEAYDKAMEEFWVKQQESEINSICYQMNTALGCLQPLKTIAEECQSSEGITIFKFVSLVCQNNGTYFNDFINDECGSSIEFESGFSSCARGNGLFQNYGGKRGLELIFEDLCGFGRRLRECSLEGIQAGTLVSKCQQSSRNMNNFMEQLGIGGSGPESAAVSACLLA